MVTLGNVELEAVSNVELVVMVTLQNVLAHSNVEITVYSVMQLSVI